MSSILGWKNPTKIGPNSNQNRGLHLGSNGKCIYIYFHIFPYTYHKNQPKLGWTELPGVIPKLRMMPPCCQRPVGVFFFFSRPEARGGEILIQTNQPNKKRSYHRNKPSMSVMFFPIFSVCFFVKKHNKLKKKEIVLFPTAVFKWLEDFFHCSQKHRRPEGPDLKQLHPLQRWRTTHDPNMPCGKRRYVPSDLTPWNSPQERLAPVFRLDVYVFHRFFYEGKNNSIESQVSEEKKHQQKSRVKSVWNLVIFYDFLPPFSGQIFSPMDSVGVSKLHLFFFVVFFLPPRLLKQSQRRQEFGGFC